ncbi:MAG: undecaprenyl/decaprenyl-phosphate alpha-N-acetylglucosaminyl 1-phosphate transferase [Chloroflexota bacterium]|nr:undecaprenyl/decaprenyl-phosphate alpha-N-acetylglucosaminyl 1-phosphate transferase [Chloroflexota bacterium]
MSQPLIVLLVFATTGAASALFVAKSIVLSRKLGLLDQPGPRRVHPSPVPRGAGLPMYVAFCFGIALTYVVDVFRYKVETERLLLLLAATGLLTVVMLYDDAVGLGAGIKLAWQVTAAALVVLPRLRGEDHGIVIDRFNSPFGGTVALPLLAAVGFTLFWLVGMTNTLNLLDGLDGLAGSVTLVACTVLFVHTYFWPRENPQFTISLLPAVLGGVLVGFLPFNWHPARTIMGDAGANFLGFTLAVISIIGGAKIAAALLALGLPVLDVAWVIVYRIIHGRSPVGADRGHLHHRLLDGGWTQPQIVGFVAGISALFGFAALVLPTREAKLGAIGAVGIVLLTTVADLARRDRRRRATARQLAAPRTSTRQ